MELEKIIKGLKGRQDQDELIEAAIEKLQYILDGEVILTACAELSVLVIKFKEDIKPALKKIEEG